ncbi:hypothetical protein P3X46_004652 [Hevea brasiliensis]|uniref:Bifunctional inhibitor/plant lipid transfer protein/seed storage helical domain-containing protein n=1 Tax=Hevea brasiliensis TaxID=3981 RepID=A0ABQ9MYB5_HEVBR|nr:hypothetical protein P3X46_004652 [Hevea brasiliensis]
MCTIIAIILSATTIIFSSTLCIAQAPTTVPFSTIELPLGLLAPATNDCFASLLNMSDCLTYMEDSMVSNPICLCEMLGNSSLVESYAIKIDMSRSLNLPTICGVNTPLLNACLEVGHSLASLIPSKLSSSLDVQPSQPESLARSPLAKDNDNGASKVTSYAESFFVGLAFSFLVTLF